MSARRKVVAVASAAAGALAVVGVTPTFGVSSVASGWWTSVPGLPAPLNTTSSPASPGPGQLGVAANSSGATSIAAVRFGLDAGETPTSLMLAIAGGTPQSAVVVACPASGSWSTAAGGPMTDAPAAACGSHQSIAQVTSDNNLVFALDAGFTTGDKVDLVIAPGAVDVGGQKITPTFNLVLTAPTTSSLATKRVAAPAPAIDYTSSTTGTPTTEDPNLGLTPAAPTTPVYSSPESTAPTTNVAEPAPEAAPPVAPVVVPAKGVALGPTRRAVGSDESDRARNFGLLLFPLAFLGAIWALNATTPGLRGIGRLAHGMSEGGDAIASPSAGGLARFRRERTAPPVPLR